MRGGEWTNTQGADVKGLRFRGQPELLWESPARWLAQPHTELCPWFLNQIPGPQDGAFGHWSPPDQGMMNSTHRSSDDEHHPLPNIHTQTQQHTGSVLEQLLSPTSGVCPQRCSRDDQNMSSNGAKASAFNDANSSRRLQ